MAAILMDGKALGLKIRERGKENVLILKEKGIVPCLAVVLVGENPASITYVKSKEKALAEAGMESCDIRLPESVSEQKLLSIITELNNDKKVHGILVQMPLPKHIDEDKITASVAPEKDVDCFHPVSVGNMVLGREGFLPCTPHGVLLLLREYNIPVSGANVVIIGRSNIVGKPLANLLIRREYNATVTICHTGTNDLAHHTLQADILIAAAGKPEFVKADMIKKGAVVIDVGINRVPDAKHEGSHPDNSSKKGYRVCGDVDPEVFEKASFFTPVPGGVGPMTIALLIQNAAYAAQIASQRK